MITTSSKTPLETALRIEEPAAHILPHSSYVSVCTFTDSSKQV